MITSFLELTAGSMFIIALAYIAMRAGAIDLSGSITGAIISFVVFFAGGARWLLVIVTFFVVSAVLTRYEYEYKRKLGSAQEKGGRRSWPNTLANGGVAAIFAAFQLYFHNDVYTVAFLTSVAAAMSDTIATEVGLLSRSKPRLITNISKVVEPGTSGGISGLGELVAFGSALGLGTLGVSLLVFERQITLAFLPAVLSIVVGALLGSTIDSLLGATVQGEYRCSVCGALTENRYHHTKKAILVKGSRMIDNNVVNFISILGGSLLSIFLYLLLL